MASQVRIVNPAALRRVTAASEECARYSDAPMCRNGEQDVDCGSELYRGCCSTETDCADNSGNDDDSCCAGWGPGTGDNIDHEYCATRDASYGGTCFIWDDGNSPEEENQDVGCPTFYEACW